MKKELFVSVAGVVAAVLLFFAIGGCAGEAQQKAVAQPAPKPDRLEITRNNPLHQKIVPLAQPFVSQDAQVVDDVYTALLAVDRPFPKGTLNCPASWGVTYHLTFLKGQQKVLEADVDGSGCQTVTILPDQKWYGIGGKGDVFFAVLGKTLGLNEQQLRGVSAPKSQ